MAGSSARSSFPVTAHPMCPGCKQLASVLRSFQQSRMCLVGFGFLASQVCERMQQERPEPEFCMIGVPMCQVAIAALYCDLVGTALRSCSTALMGVQLVRKLALCQICRRKTAVECMGRSFSESCSTWGSAIMQVARRPRNQHLPSVSADLCVQAPN